MKPLIAKVRPVGGYAWIAHIVLLSLLPLIVLVLVKIDLVPIAVLVILLSKWRMFAVKPRFWLVNIRANSVDILVGLSLLTFIADTSSYVWQLGWTVLYIGWLTAIKPRSTTLMIALQALIAFICSLSALFLVGDKLAAIYLVIVGGIICYLTAYHFLSAFEEAYTKLLAYVWGFFGASLIWILSHWLLYYPVNGFVAQPTLLLLTIGYGLAAIYYLHHTDRLSKGLRNQFVFIMLAITVIILRFSDWSAKIV